MTFSLAVVNDDYIDADTIQLFGKCAKKRCLYVPILDDDVVEGEEKVIISLSSPSDSRISVSPFKGEIVITDDN